MNRSEIPHYAYTGPLAGIKMKRYRILGWDFDTRILALTQLEEVNKRNPSPELERQVNQIKESLITQYGTKRADQKLQNLKDIGPKQFSIVGYHNVLLTQVRDSFVFENYYPSLTSACSLGERILNHLILDLRNDYSETEEYQEVKNQKSFTNWDIMINTLSNWEVLLPTVTEKFRDLKKLRHKSVHFNPNLTIDLRKYAFEAVKLIQEILFEQFSASGIQPWFITGIPGEIYIKIEWEDHPFISKFYLPNSIYVGPKHRIKSLEPLQIEDEDNYSNTTIDDTEFVRLRENKIPANNG